MLGNGVSFCAHGTCVYTKDPAIWLVAERTAGRRSGSAKAGRFDSEYALIGVVCKFVAAA
jgi:hypothetical protein